MMCGMFRARGWLHPTGPRVVGTVGAFLMLIVTSNIVATFFWRSTGGVGFLDMDGGENVLQPNTGPPFPAAGTEARTQALLDAYSANARSLHMVATCTLDLIFPAAIAVMCWVTIVWACTRPDGDRPRWCLWVAGGLAIAYLVADWGENLIELYLLGGGRGAAVNLLHQVTSAKLGVFAAVAIAMAVFILARALRRWSAARSMR